MKIKANNSNSNNNNNNNNLNNIHNVTQILTRRKFWPFSKHKTNTKTTHTTTAITTKKLTCSKILWSGCRLSVVSIVWFHSDSYTLNTWVKWIRVPYEHTYDFKWNVLWLHLRHITTILVYMTICSCMELNQRDYGTHMKSSTNVRI